MYSGCTESLLTSSQTVVHNSLLKVFCQSLEVTISFTSGYHTRSSGQFECANKDLETSLHCLTPSSSCFLEHLPSVDWVCTQHIYWDVTFHGCSKVPAPTFSWSGDRGCYSIHWGQHKILSPGVVGCSCSSAVFLSPNQRVRWSLSLTCFYISTWAKVWLS